jgi:hypothetical protein
VPVSQTPPHHSPYRPAEPGKNSPPAPEAVTRIGASDYVERALYLSISWHEVVVLGMHQCFRPDRIVHMELPLLGPLVPLAVLVTVNPFR